MKNSLPRIIRESLGVERRLWIDPLTLKKKTKLFNVVIEINLKDLENTKHYLIDPKTGTEIPYDKYDQRIERMSKIIERNPYLMKE